MMINFVNLLFHQPYNIRKQVRNIETNEKKLIQAKMAVVFNSTCINGNLLPTFTNILIYTHTRARAIDQCNHYCHCSVRKVRNLIIITILNKSSCMEYRLCDMLY